MNDQYLTHLGEHLRERAIDLVSLLNFMIENAEPEVWAKANADGLKPSDRSWVVSMNKHRTKRTATIAEAEEIVRLHQEQHGAGCDCCLIIHALTDPVWALRGFRHVAKDCGLMESEI